MSNFTWISFFLTFGMLLSFMSQSMLAVEDEELLEHILIINNEKKQKNIKSHLRI